MEKQLISALVYANKTLAVCESLTAGMLCSRLCGVAGASAAVKGGLITYCNEAKISLAGVPKNIIDTYTEVSEECAFFMAKGVAERLDADIGVSLTGYAGPTGKDVGKVCIGVFTQKGGRAKTFCFSGNRDEIRASAAEKAMEWVLAVLREEG